MGIERFARGRFAYGRLFTAAWARLGVPLGESLMGSGDCTSSTWSFGKLPAPGDWDSANVIQGNFFQGAQKVPVERENPCWQYFYKAAPLLW